MGPPTREFPWTAWAHGHPRQVTIDRLLRQVRGTRPTTTMQVATGQHKFTSVTINKAIYATGWDGSVVLETDLTGAWKALDDAPRVPLVNLNTASVEELMTLPMIGQTRAQAIVQNRTQRGLFATVDDLGRVPGIGRGTISAIRNFAMTEAR